MAKPAQSQKTDLICLPSLPKTTAPNPILMNHRQ